MVSENRCHRLIYPRKLCTFAILTRNLHIEMKHCIKSLITIMALALCLQSSAQTNKWQDIHRVKKGETIFGIAREYNISLQELIDANPDMKQEGYELKKGDWVFVPYAKKKDLNNNTQPSVSQAQAVTTTAQTAPKAVKPNDGVIRVGVMLPLHNNDGDGRRMVEYYRGMLLALNQLDSEGIKTEVQAWNVPIDCDIRTKLLDDGAGRLDVVFGPLYSDMVQPLGDFCKLNNINMVIPFSINGNDVERNEKIFQIYQTPDMLNNKAIAAFMERFPKHHPIFIDCNDPTSDKGVFTSGLRRKLETAGRNYNLTNLRTPQTDFAKAFSADQPNVIVLNSARSPQLNQVFAKLDSLKTTHPGIAISMFGYNEWFMYQRYDLAQFFKYSVYIPTTYYYNAVSDRTEEFEKLYLTAYGEPMDANALPRFAITGYDHTMFFIRGMKEQGSKFNGNGDVSKWKPLQTRLNFKRAGQGGYRNQHFQLVHFKVDQTMEAITY